MVSLSLQQPNFVVIHFGRGGRLTLFSPRGPENVSMENVGGIKLPGICHSVINSCFIIYKDTSHME